MTKFASSTSRLPLRVHCLALLVFLAALSGIALPQASLAPPSSPGENFRITVNANLVILHATAQDRKGVLVSGLEQASFQVYENGVLQQIKHFSHDDIPVTVGLVIDNSGSMSNKRSEVIAAALAFARSSNPQDQMFVVNFNEHVRFALPAGMPFTDKSPELEAALSRINTNGQTALYDAVAAALEHLKKGAREKRVLIVISDGGDNASKQNLARVMAMAQNSDAAIYTIGIFDEQDEDRNPRVLKQLASDTGGDVFLPRSLKEVVPICEQIARDIRNQYTIAYVPTNRKQDGTYRTIEVTASAAGHRRLSVRTRAGYRAPLQAQPLPVGKAGLP
ncbi:MAG TPA: VWA domain-containing protein [Candidatus Saccharimonadales bacterium]|jgi:Ca-activated chloride channel family protein|nr:VWA domain-containing protein [Candidatus Saccharimonadales bacterium]